MVPEPLRRLDRAVGAKRFRAIVRFRVGNLQSRFSASANVLDLPGGYERIYFHHLRKTGGTSMVQALYALSGAERGVVERRLARYSFAHVGNINYVTNNVALITSGRFGIASSHHPLFVARPPVDGTFRFTVLRDPVDRVLSLYRYLSDASSDDGFRFKAPDKERQLAADGFDRFLDQIPPSSLLNQIYTFSERGDVGEAVEEVTSLQLVLRTEDLEHGTATLSSMLGLPLHIGRARVSRAQFEATPAQIERARLMTAPEYELLERVPRVPVVDDA